jgi:ceramide synthetase
MFAAYYIFNAMLTILLCLHGFWTYYICKVAFKALSTGKVDKDERSSSETLSDLESSEETGIGEKVRDGHMVHQNNHKKVS